MDTTEWAAAKLRELVRQALRCIAAEYLLMAASL